MLYGLNYRTLVQIIGVPDDRDKPQPPIRSGISRLCEKVQRQLPSQPRTYLKIV
jgi:hypothetical protein